MQDKMDKVQTSISLSGLGIVIGVILTILQGVGAIDIGWFWATFAFWIVPAVALFLVIILLLIMM